MKIIYLCLVLVLSFNYDCNAQCYMDRHSTSGTDSWTSCSESQNPILSYGLSHWIMYDLGFEYNLGEIQLWNGNVPDSTDRGVEHLVVDYSLNGTDWNFLNEIDMPEANGSATYEGLNIMDFNGQRARYILLTATSNHGGPCFSISEVKINIASTVVPISLLSFDANCKGSEVVLSWETAEELQNDHYEIQRRSVSSPWKSIGQIEAAGSSKTKLTYSYLDKNPLSEGRAFYRLVQVDQNGVTNYFDPESVDCSTAEFALNVYPNPASDRIEVLYKADQKSAVNLILVNSLGQQAEQYLLPVNEKTNFEVSHLEAGNYLLKIEQGSDLIVRNLVIIK